MVGVHWITPWKPLQTTVQARLVGDQFADDENTLSLASYATVDVRVSLQINAHWQGWVSVENLFDSEVETGRSAGGVVSVGAPRLLDAGMRVEY